MGLEWGDRLTLRQIMVFSSINSWVNTSDEDKERAIIGERIAKAREKPLDPQQVKELLQGRNFAL